jgi:hypothetical protein
MLGKGNVPNRDLNSSPALLCGLGVLCEKQSEVPFSLAKHAKSAKTDWRMFENPQFEIRNSKLPKTP